MSIDVIVRSHRFKIVSAIDKLTLLFAYIKDVEFDFVKNRLDISLYTTVDNIIIAPLLQSSPILQLEVTDNTGNTIARYEIAGIRIASNKLKLSYCDSDIAIHELQLEYHDIERTL